MEKFGDSFSHRGLSKMEMTEVLPLFLHPLFIVSFFLLFVFLLFKRHRSSDNKYNLPPSPPRLPVIGNLHQLGTHPHHSLRALSDKYGALMLLHLGCVPTLVVSSADMVREIVKTHDIAFSNRPKTTASDIIAYGSNDLAFSPYGEFWRQIRKICVLELLSLRRVQQFQYVRDEEVVILNNRIRRSTNHGDNGTPIINLSEMLMETSNNIVFRCIVGRRSSAEEGGGRWYAELSRRVTMQFMAFSVGDFFPSLTWIDHLRGFTASLRSTSKALDDFSNKVVEEHKATMIGTNVKDFVDILLKLQKESINDFELTKDNVKAILQDMLVAGTETTSTTLEWLMAELVKNPRVMKKAQEEVRRAVGNKSKIDTNDVSQMNYLKCIVKENMRLHPAAPLLVARETRESVENLGGYHIPAKTRVFINAWAIQRSPSSWDKPEEFIPERFENSSVDFKGQDPQLVPFGFGRRGCPGLTFAIASIEYVIANLLYWFDWKLPGGDGVMLAEELDMSEGFGLTVYKKVPLHLVPMSYSP